MRFITMQLGFGAALLTLAAGMPADSDGSSKQIDFLAALNKDGLTYEIVPPRPQSGSAEFNRGRNSIAKRTDYLDCHLDDGHAPLIDDCNALVGQIGTYDETIFVDPGYCHQASVGTCVGWICAYCDQLEAHTADWAGVLNDIVQGCLYSYGEAGRATDDETWAVGIDYSGEELPNYGACTGGNYPTYQFPDYNNVSFGNVTHDKVKQRSAEAGGE